MRTNSLTSSALQFLGASVALAALTIPSVARADGDAAVETSPAVATTQPPPARVRPPSAADLPDTEGYIAPKAVPYEGGEIPSNAKIVNKPNLYFVGTGVGLFAASYLGSLLYALSTCSAQEACRPGSAYLYIPIIGPFITAAVQETPTTGGRALAGFSGGVQLLGAALAVAGFVWPQHFVMWQSKTAKLTVVPTSGGLATPSSPAFASASAAADKPAFSAGFAVTLTNL